jgi:O-antigen biosynthesis protein WbqP
LHLYKRALDLSLALLLIPFLAPLFVILALLIKATSKGPVLYWSNRAGRNNRLFWMPKFRSMRIDTPQLASHLLSDPSLYLTPIGRFLRRTSLDELPQFFSILAGDQSFVGPRPALFNQADLIALRTDCGVHQLVPGLTGWAQVNGRDGLTIPIKVEFDREYLDRQSVAFDFRILWMTAFKVVRREGVHH